MSECRKSLDRRLKTNVGAFRGSSTSVKKATKSSTATERSTTAVEKKSVSGKLIPVMPGQLTVRRVPRVDIDKMMMDGVREMDVIWHSAAEAAEAMQSGPYNWQVATVVQRATKKFLAKKVARQRRKLLQQLVAVRGDAANVDEQSPLDPVEMEQLVGEAVSSRSCRTDLLRHLLSSAPPEDVNKTTYECH